MNISLPCKFEDKPNSNKQLIFYSIVYNMTLDYDPPAILDWKANYPKHYQPIAVNI